MRRGPAIAGLALLAFGGQGAAIAQSQQGMRWNPKAPENAQLLPTFNYASIEAVLKSIGASWRRTGREADKPSLLVTFRNGRRAVIALSACDRSGASCKAMNLQVSWARLDKVPTERAMEAVAQFNRRYAFAKAFVIGGKPSLQRYFIADYGYVRGNLAVEMQVFADQAQRFTVEVLQPLQKAER